MARYIYLSKYIHSQHIYGSYFSIHEEHFNTVAFLRTHSLSSRLQDGWIFTRLDYGRIFCRFFGSYADFDFSILPNSKQKWITGVFEILWKKELWFF